MQQPLLSKYNNKRQCDNDEFFKTFTLNHDLCITSINASDFFIKPHNGMKCYPTSTW